MAVQEASISYHLDLSFRIERQQGMTRQVNDITRRYDHEMFRMNFEMDFKGTPLARFEQAQEKMSGAEFKAEQDLFGEHIPSVLNEMGESVDYGAIDKAVTTYLNASSLFAPADEDSLRGFAYRFAQTQTVFSEFNQMDTDDMEISELRRHMAHLERSIANIWGDDAQLNWVSQQKLAEEFDYFDQIIDELDAHETLIPATTKLHLSLGVKEARGLSEGFFSGRLPRKFEDTVAFWQLPTTFFEIRKALNIAPEHIPAFRLYADIQHEDLFQSFRVAVSGDKEHELVADLKERCEGALRDRGVQDFRPLKLSFTLHSVDPEHPPILEQTPVFESFENGFSAVKKQLHRSAQPSIKP